MGQPQNWPTIDTYKRYDWKSVEPRKGVYDFSEIRRDLKRVSDEGGLFSFRIMPLNMSLTDGSGTSLPAYLDSDVRTWKFPAYGGNWSIPDWNSPTYIQAWSDMCRALALEFDGNENISYIDISGIGHYGEGHNHPYGSGYPGPLGQVSATVESAKKIALSQINNFSKTRLLWNLTTFIYGSDGKFKQSESDNLMVDILSYNATIGLRFDCIGGGQTQNGAWLALDRAQKISEDRGLSERYQPGKRWMYAPVVTEWCSNVTPLAEIPPGSVDRGTIQEGLDQVVDRHISSVSSHNYKHSWSGSMDRFYSASEVSQFEEASKLSGFRLAFSVRAHNEKVEIVWENLGSAPIYRNCRVEYAISSEIGDYAIQGAVDLRNLLPGGRLSDWVDLSPTSGAFTIEPRAYVVEPRAQRLQLAVAQPGIIYGTYRMVN